MDDMLLEFVVVKLDFEIRFFNQFFDCHSLKVEFVDVARIHELE